VPLTVQPGEFNLGLHVGSTSPGRAPEVDAWTVDVTPLIVDDDEELSAPYGACALSPEHAERVAAKLLHSAAVARYMRGDGGPPVSSGPASRRRIVERLDPLLVNPHGRI
jgi:hypothetical protein